MGMASALTKGLAISGLVLTLFVGELTPSGGSVGDFSISSDDGSIQEDVSPRTHNELTATRGIGKSDSQSKDRVEPLKADLGENLRD